MEGLGLVKLYAIVAFEVVVIWKEVMLTVRTQPRHTFGRGDGTARSDISDRNLELSRVHGRYPTEPPQPQRYEWSSDAQCAASNHFKPQLSAIVPLHLYFFHSTVRASAG